MTSCAETTDATSWEGHSTMTGCSSPGEASVYSPADLNVLSSDFFVLYDGLEFKARNLEDHTKALQQAKAERDQEQSDLKKLQLSVRKTQRFIQEQTARIHLVETHWFYGTTALQPQLWFKGGCTGKVERAKVKREEAQERTLPPLQEKVQHLQATVIPQHEAHVSSQFRKFEMSANAASERELLRQRALEEYPSPTLTQFQNQMRATERNHQEEEGQLQSIQRAIKGLEAIDSSYTSIQRTWEKAQKHNAQHTKLMQKKLFELREPAKVLEQAKKHRRGCQETVVADGTKIIMIPNPNGRLPKDVIHLGERGKILTTNFPCPHPDCDHLVTWHATHCCGACARYHEQQHCNSRLSSSNGSFMRHGPRCERQPLSRQQGAQEKKDAQHRHQQELVRKREKEQKSLQECLNTIQQKYNQVERFIRDILTEEAGLFSLLGTDGVMKGAAPMKGSSIGMIQVLLNLADEASSSTLECSPPSSSACSASCSSSCQSTISTTTFQQNLEKIRKSKTTLAQQVCCLQQIQAGKVGTLRKLDNDKLDQQSCLQQEERVVFSELRRRAQGFAAVSAPSMDLSEEVDDFAAAHCVSQDDAPLPPAFAPHHGIQDPMVSSIALQPSAPSEDDCLDATMLSALDSSATDIPFVDAVPVLSSGSMSSRV